MPSTPRTRDWIATAVTGIRRRDPAGAPTLVLTAIQGGREFHAPLAPDVAHLLAHEFHEDPTRYALSCTLVEEILGWTGGRIAAVRLGGGRADSLEAEIEVHLHGKRRAVRADPGEAVLLAWRQNLPVMMSASLADVLPRGHDHDDSPLLQQFRTFVQQLTPQQFAC